LFELLEFVVKAVVVLWIVMLVVMLRLAVSVFMVMLALLTSLYDLLMIGAERLGAKQRERASGHAWNAAAEVIGDVWDGGFTGGPSRRR
jgi:hypothetical protein